MRKLVLKMSMSLDGFVAGPNGETDWMVRGRGPDSAAWVLETLSEAGIHAIGRRTYESMASYWPTSTDQMATPMNEIPKAIFTRQESLDLPTGIAEPVRSPATGGWVSPRIANGELAEEIRRLKEEPGKYILAQGGAGFARSLIQHGLVDEYRLVVHPVVLGRGLAIFDDLQLPMNLELVTTSAFRSGVVAQVYRAADEESVRR